MHSFSSLRHKRRDPISNFSTIAIGQRSFDLVSPSSTEFYQFQWLGSMISGATRFDAIRRISIASSSGFIPRQSGALESEERWNTARSHSNAGRSRLFRCGPSLVPVGILRRGGGGRGTGQCRRRRTIESDDVDMKEAEKGPARVGPDPSSVDRRHRDLQRPFIPLTWFYSCFYSFRFIVIHLIVMYSKFR